MKKKRGRPARVGVPRGGTGRIKRSFSAAEQEQREAAEAAADDRNARSLAQWRRAQEIVTALLPDTRLASPLGRMLLLGKPVRIDLAQYEAAERLFAILQTYDRLVLGVSRDARGIDLIGAHGRVLRAEPDAELVESAKVRMASCEAVLDGVDHAMGASRPAVKRSAMTTVASATKDLVRGLSGVDVTQGRDGKQAGRLGLAVEGLTALAQYWKLDVVKSAKIRRFGDKAVFTTDGRPIVYRVQRGDDGQPVDGGALCT